MLTSIDVKFIFNCLLSVSLEDKGLFSATNAADCKRRIMDFWGEANVIQSESICVYESTITQLILF